MITRIELNDHCQRALQLIDSAGITLTREDQAKITAADFGLSNLSNEGIQILTMFETDRIAGKILVLLPFQTEPEHWHPPVGNDPGKEEIIRAISGDLYFYLPGPDTMKQGFLIEGKESCYSMRNEMVLQPGDQLVLAPGTKHWFQAGESGAVMFSFSTTVRDILDEFTDPDIVRETVIVD